MDRDSNSSSRAWLALSCARDGTITQTLHDDLGLTRSAARGARLADIVDPGSRTKSEKFIAALASRGCLVGWDINVPAGDGAQPLFFAGGSGSNTLLVLGAADAQAVTELFDEVASTNVEISTALRALIDEQRVGITEALRRDNELYEELSRLNNELINRERELARKTAALERLSAEKTRMAAIAAHDLRNPLTVVASYAALLKIDSPLNDEQRFYVEEIERSARFMVELVEEMLDAARLESGKLKIDFQPVDLVQAARHAATINRIRAERKEISLTFESDSDSAMIRADPVKLRQIINNLVVNAIKFSPPHTAVTLRVKCTGSGTVVEVEDRGVGIPREKIPVIFEPFKTLQPSGTAGEVSTGLGLAIVKQLADLHGASIEVDSDEGSGARFGVVFPPTT